MPLTSTSDAITYNFHTRTIMGSRPLKNLTSLGIHLDDEEIVSAKFIIQICSSLKLLMISLATYSLQRLVNIDKDDSSMSVLLDLPMQIASLAFSLFEVPRAGSTFLTWVINEINNFPANNNLIEIYV
ncbi:hypothetical protein AX16_010167 [Volvariella volvacea WC 439]|nr:hypothetical protein AX16_010167 [Volvariella volvacea WC 439]